MKKFLFALLNRTWFLVSFSCFCFFDLLKISETDPFALIAAEEFMLSSGFKPFLLGCVVILLGVFALPFAVFTVLIDFAVPFVSYIRAKFSKSASAPAAQEDPE